MMTEHRGATNRWFARWREQRRVKRQQAIERRYADEDRLNPTPRAYTDADNHARRWTSFLGGGGR
jgi:hypothetical protein